MDTKITQVIKRSGAVVPFNPERITNAIYRAAVAVGGRDRETAENLSIEVVRILEEQTPEDKIPCIEDIQDIVEKVLIENGHAQVAKAYILYRSERELRRKERAEKAIKPSENIPWAKLWHVLNWSVDQGTNTIAGLNQRIKNGELPDLIHASEKAYREDVENAAELVAARSDELRMVIITGPSSSGKTTTTTKINQRLSHIGKKLVTLNVDHYFFSLDMHPKDEFGDYDFETPQALNLKLINEHLKSLFAGEEVLIPYYDFKTGQSQPDHTPMQLEPGDIVLIDSLHGLYKDMSEGIPAEYMFKLYLEPLLQMKDDQGKYIRWTDIRLMRRMLRDATFRAYDFRKTLLHWHYVRSSEMRNIIPYINTVDYIVNSAMPYELALYTHKLRAEFAQWVEDYHEDPLRQDAFFRAQRVSKLLNSISPVDDDTGVPSDSVIREFIGGSIYDLH
ncbi:MAG: hypothetical protein JEZ06_17655 [Anaerolineaceae bacterium]|nr:hypothetical protein [Anaerolineaceae bacterium]